MKPALILSAAAILCSLPAGPGTAQDAAQTGKMAPPGHFAVLGVAFKDIPSAARHQLPSLKDGGGLLINALLPGSPAAEAGLQPDDVLARCDGQIIFSEAQFTGLLLNRKPGDSLKLEIFRSGQSLEVKTQLTASATGAASPLVIDAARAQRKEAAERLLLDFLRQHSREECFPELLELLPPRCTTHTAASGRVTQCQDDAGAMELSASGNKTTVRLRDTKGATIFEGAYASEAEKAALPPFVRDRIAQFAPIMEQLPGASGK